jgi:hypothetical protein
MQTRISVQRRLALAERVARQPVPRALEHLEIYAVMTLKTLQTSKPSTGHAASCALIIQAIRLLSPLEPHPLRP